MSNNNNKFSNKKRLNKNKETYDKAVMAVNNQERRG